MRNRSSFFTQIFFFFLDYVLIRLSSYILTKETVYFINVYERIYAFLRTISLTNATHKRLRHLYSVNRLVLETGVARFADNSRRMQKIYWAGGAYLHCCYIFIYSVYWLRRLQLFLLQCATTKTYYCFSTHSHMRISVTNIS